MGDRNYIKLSSIRRRKNMKTWTELEDINGRTFYVDLTKLEAVCAHGENQSVVVLNGGVKIYTRHRPAEIMQMMTRMLGA